MSAPRNHEEVISLLRSADLATLYFYSQHMAEIVLDLAAQVVVFQDLIVSRNSFNILPALPLEQSYCLTKISLSAIVDEETLNGFIEAMKQDWIEE